MDVRPPQYGPGSASAAGPAQPGLVRVPGPLSGPCQSVSQPASQPARPGRRVPAPVALSALCGAGGGGARLARGGEGRAGGFGELGLQAGTGGQAVGFVPQCEAASAWAAQGQRGLVLRWCGWFLTLQA